jgi:hypothetical protein
MRQLCADDPGLFAERSEELAYLANVLVAGCSFQQRRLRPIEALRAVMASCSLGLWLASPVAPSGRRGSDPVRQALATLRRLPADGLFRMGWHRSHQELTDRAAAVGVTLMERAAGRADRGDRTELKRAAARLSELRAAGAPWRGLPLLDALIGRLDAPLLEALLGLLDECPSLRGELARRSGRQADRRAQDAPRFACTPAELERARLLLDRLVTRRRSGLG